ncbi:MAG: hypoxanthine phosphoribosyltransferase [Clostridiales bacterium]|nr:hypoxanthine phosphoribosyltransferase [Clostridiales bacterium]
MQNDIKEVLISEEEIKEMIKELGRKIDKDYKGKNLLLVSVLKGSIVFMADLMRAINLPCQIDFMAVSSYGAGTTSSGAVKILKDLDTDLEGFDVLIIEDILDSGKTLSYILKILKSRKPASLKICTLFDKPKRRKVKLKADYFGCVVPDEFIVGYGLDYAEIYRNLPFVAVLKENIYNENETN